MGKNKSTKDKGDKKPKQTNVKQPKRGRKPKAPKLDTPAAVFEKHMKEAKENKILSSKIACVDGASPSTLQYAASLADIIAMCQYALQEVIRKHPNVFDFDSANPTTTTITPSGFVAYNLLAFIQAFADADCLNAQIPATTNFPREAPVLTCIAELIRGYIRVGGAPTISRSLSISSDITIPNSSVVPYASGSPLSVCNNQFPTGSGNEFLGWFARDVSGTSLQTYSDYTLDSYNKNWSGLFSGPTPFSGSVEFNAIVTWLSTSKLSRVPYSKIQIWAVDYTGFCFPNTGSPLVPGLWWNFSTVMNSPSKYFDPDYAPVFSPTTGTYTPPRTVPAPLFTAPITPPSFTVRGNYAGNAINNAVVPSNQTKISEAFFKFYYRVMATSDGETTLSTTPLFKTQSYAMHRQVIRLSKMIGVSIDTCGLVSDMMTAFYLTIGKKEIGVGFSPAVNNILYNAALSALMRRIVSHMPDLNQSLGCLSSVCPQTLIPDVTWNVESMHPFWAWLLDCIGPVCSNGYGFYPVVSQIATANDLNLSNSVSTVKFASLMLSGNTNPRASAYGQFINGNGTYSINFPDAFIKNNNGGGWTSATYPVPNGQITAAECDCYVNTMQGNGNFESNSTAPFLILQFGSTNWVANSTLKTAYDNAPTVPGTAVKRVLSYWTESAGNFMISLQAMWENLGAHTLGLARKTQLSKFGWSNMWANSYRLVDFEGTSNAIGANMLITATQTKFVVQTANCIEYAFSENRFGFLNHISSAKMYVGVRSSLAATYYAGNTSNVVQGMPFEKSLQGNNVHALTIDYIAQFASHDGVIQKKIDVLVEKRKTKQIQVDGGVTIKNKSQSKDAPDNAMDKSVKQNMVENADPTDIWEVPVQDLVKEAEILEGQEEGVPSKTYGIEAVSKDEKNSYTKEDFNWKGAAKTTAKIGAELCTGLVMLL